jgi:hypothetical protein
MHSKKKPCKQCPFRKNSAKGWLGGDSGNPEQFLQQLDHPNFYPCHSAINWERENVDEQGMKAPRCAGALQFMNNSMMQSRNSEVRELQKPLGKNDEVMQFKHNFIEYHKLA